MRLGPAPEPLRRVILPHALALPAADQELERRERLRQLTSGVTAVSWAIAGEAIHQDRAEEGEKHVLARHRCHDRTPAKSTWRLGRSWDERHRRSTARASYLPAAARRVHAEDDFGLRPGLAHRRDAAGQIDVDVADHHLVERLRAPADHLARVGVIRVLLRVIVVGQAIDARCPWASPSASARV